MRLRLLLWEGKHRLTGFNSYIKELAERLHTLESQMHPGMTNSDMANSEMQYQAMGEMSSPRNYQDFSPPADTGTLGRKRTYSVLEGFPSASFTQPPFPSRGPQFGMLFLSPLHLPLTDSSRRARNIYRH